MSDDPYRDHLAREVKRLREGLAGLAEQIERRMAGVSIYLGQDPDPIINGIGELQGLGPALDAACAAYAQARQALKDYDAFEMESRIGR